VGAYISRNDIGNAIAEDVLKYLVDDERQGSITPAGEERIEQRIQDAESEVNSYLAQRYTLPLPEVPPVLKARALDIAVYRLFLRRGIRPGSADESVIDQYRLAVSWLKDVATGRASLTFANGPEGSDGAKVGGGSKPRIAAQRRIFSRDSLEDF
jgi:phage gp36-like protein